MMVLKPLHALAAAAVIASGAAGALAGFPEPAEAQRVARNAQAEAFMQAQASRALAILSNRTLSRPQKEAQFRAFVDEVVDVPGISRYVLGRYARTASGAQRAQFQQVFREYASNLYEARLGDYRGERIQVTGSLARNANDVVVNSVISGGQLRQPETVRWRLARSGGAWKVQDVEVRGIWLAVVQQQDYVSTLDAAGGNLNVLINQLRGEVARPNAR
jgi:phospholipid transport system substrate-binding protein